MGKCIIRVDRTRFKPGEAVYITLSNVGNEALYLGTWQILDSTQRVIFSMEPPQVLIQPLSSFMVVWFQVDNEGKQVKQGRYWIIWKPKDESGNEYSCSTQIEIT